MVDSAALPWADQPYALLSSARISKDKNAHGAQKSALEMTHVHNTFLRTLNSILLQAPYIPDASTTTSDPMNISYNPEDVKDLVYYTSAFLTSLDQHHHTEETVLFPLLATVPGVPSGGLDAPVEQHAAFHSGIVELQKYCEEVMASPEKHRWKEMKRILDSFAPALLWHLKDEIDVLLGLDELVDSAEVTRCWKVAENAALKALRLNHFYDVLPSTLGSADHTFEDGNGFPPVPSVVTYAVDWWTARRGGRPGAWRLCPCDFWGRPRKLVLLEERVQRRE